jgi:hypothetical protein
MTALQNRVVRLEQRLAPDPADPFGFVDLSIDQFRILLLDVGRALILDPQGPSVEMAEMQAKVADVEEKIRCCAASFANPEYAAHWLWVQEMWAEWFPGSGEFVPPITDSSYWWSDDASRRSAEMQWRTQMRARPDIAALVAQGEVRHAGIVQ